VLDTGALHLPCADKHRAKRLLILAPAGLVLNQPSDVWAEGETLTAQCCSGKKLSRPLLIASVPNSLSTADKPIVLHREEVKQR